MSKKRAAFIKDFPLHLMLLPGVIVTLIFAYLPMFGLVMAFQNFKPLKSFWGSKFVGFDNFKYIFSMPDLWSSLQNTVVIAFAKIVLGLFVPLVLALLVNEMGLKRYKRAVQTTIFIPFFISWAMLGGIIIEVFGYDGIINSMISSLGFEPILFLVNNKWFPAIIVGTDVWKGMGYNMVIFLAAITNVDPSLYEVSMIDGAGRWKQMLNITLPTILPIVVLMSILGIGGILNAGFDQILMLYSPVVYKSGDIIDTFVYRLGMFNVQYSAAAAAGLFKSIVSALFVLISYIFAYKFSDYRVF